jgi:hypothetical protein
MLDCASSSSHPSYGHHVPAALPPTYHSTKCAGFLGDTESRILIYPAKRSRLGRRSFESLQRAQCQRKTLTSTADANKTSDWAAVAFLLDAQIRERVLAYVMLAMMRIVFKKSTYRRRFERTDSQTGTDTLLSIRFPESNSSYL